MEEQTLHILNECSSGCKMAIHSMQQVLEYVENEKLEQVIMAAERKHKGFLQKLVKTVTWVRMLKKKDMNWRKNMIICRGFCNWNNTIFNPSFKIFNSIKYKSCRTFSNS